MDAIGRYVLSICCSAIIAGVIMSIGSDGAAGKIRQMICGLFIAFVVISPLREVELSELWTLPDELYREGQEITDTAQADTTAAISNIITERVGAYILDEADSLGTQIQIKDIRLDPDTLAPVCVELSGDIAPYKRSLLSDYIADTLGIGKEDQIWSR